MTAWELVGKKQIRVGTRLKKKNSRGNSFEKKISRAVSRGRLRVPDVMEASETTISAVMAARGSK